MSQKTKTNLHRNDARPTAPITQSVPATPQTTQEPPEGNGGTDGPANDPEPSTGPENAPDAASGEQEPAKEPEPTPPTDAEKTPATVSPVLKFGDNVTLIWDRLPLASQVALAQRTFSHIMGNEAAAALTAAQTRKDDPVGKDEATIAEFLTNWRAKKLEGLLAGKVSMRVSGPRLKGLDFYINAVARRRVEKSLATYYKLNPTVAKFDSDAIKTRVAQLVANEKQRPSILLEAQADMAKDIEQAKADEESANDVLAAIGLGPMEPEQETGAEPDATGTEPAPVDPATIEPAKETATA